MSNTLLNVLFKIIRILELLFGLFFLIGLCGSIDEFSNLSFWMAYIFLGIIMFAPLIILHRFIKGRIVNQEQYNETATSNTLEYISFTEHHEECTEINDTSNTNELENQLRTAQEQLNTAIEQLNDMLASGNIVEVSVHSNDVLGNNIPEEVLSNMRESYSTMQMQQDIRILADCVNILKNTKNLDTFFSRYKLAMRKSLTLEQARIAGFQIDNPFSTNYIMELKNRCDDILQANYKDELNSIKKSKTQSEKRNKIDKFISKISEYQDEFEFSDVYKDIIHDINLLKTEE